MAALRRRAGLALALLAVIACATMLVPTASAEKKIPTQKKTEKGRKMKECMDRHTKAVGHEFINPETGGVASPELHPDLSELVASKMTDGDVDVGSNSIVAATFGFLLLMYEWLSTSDCLKLHTCMHICRPCATLLTTPRLSRW